MKIKLGDKVKDKLTGFEGYVNAKAEYLYGCTQVEVQPPIDDNGNWVKSKWIDEPQLDKVSKFVSEIDKDAVNPKKKNYGGVARSHP
jgi:hypothetical protein